MINIRRTGKSKRGLIVVLAIILFSTQSFTSVASAVTPGVTPTLTTAQENALKEGAVYVNTEASTCSTGGATTSGATAPVTGASAWNSDTQPPYYLESFVINVLDDIAQTENVPQTDTVTQEHVVALIAWAYAEGGNIANTDVFNPWNTGVDDPALIAGNAAGNGVQSFVSFDAGVTAATITMTGSNQNRLAQTLIQPSTTAEQFMNALTNYQSYPGNDFWAAADQNATVDGTAYTQAGYLQALMDQLTQARTNYAQEASVEIGPGQENTSHVPATELKYTGGTSNPTTSSGTDASGCQTNGSSVSCGNGTTGNAAIACDVLKYDTLSYSQAWHSSGSVFHARCPTIGPSCATDCSGLVSIALYDVFGNDGSWTTYTMVSDKSNFKEISASELMPGDFIEPAAEAGDHVIIVESISGSTAQTFAANTDGVDQPDQVSAQPYTLSSGDIYLRYIGQGATSES